VDCFLKEKRIPRPKRNSKLVENAQRRLEAIRSIDPDLDFGQNLSSANFSGSIEKARQAIAHYNTLLSMVDEALKGVEAAEEQVSELSVRMLQNVGARYGRNSMEYIKAGGKPSSSKRKITMGTASAIPMTFSTVPLTAPTASKSASNGSKAKA
jgi:hypothetical protein